MVLLALLVLSATLWGAASYVSPPVLAVACVVIGAWLLVFAVRERLARTGRRTVRGV
ncbi:hypothetical protein [Streptacidiphilus sp. PB12-B1b]|uniref:hypothetical protein n=1 Tax=Streptacidiphilus sp. PB12-B1b TaxID=2705012 RepID=UPI0015FC7BEF|nr:hypothetical protein [Streptacidiphilus sp. PB12-B1b]